MDIVLRAAAIYVVLLLVLRLSGKRQLSQLTTFDFVLLLIMSEASQQAILGDDFSIAGGAIAVITLVTFDRLSDTVSWRWNRVDRILNDGAIVIVEDGRPHEQRMAIYRIQDDDVLEQARASQGLERMDQIKYAVLERTGSISVIPKSQG